MSRRFLSVAGAAFILVSAGAAAGQAPLPVDSPFPKAQITVELAYPCGPAVDTDNAGMFGGLGFAGGFNFMRRPSAAIGVDGMLIYAVATKIDEWDVEGSWTQVSAGLPMRIGRAVSFYFRPGLCVERLDSKLDGHESDGDYWRCEFDNSIAVGLVLGFGLDVILSDRLSMGLNFHLAILGAPHHADTYWTNYSSWEDGEKTGFVSIAALWRFSIHI